MENFVKHVTIKIKDYIEKKQAGSYRERNELRALYFMTFKNYHIKNSSFRHITFHQKTRRKWITASFSTRRK